MSENIRTENAICPYCGYEDYDSWEWAQSNEEEQDVDCSSCGKEFHLHIDYDVSYTTSVIEESQNDAQ